MLDYLDEYQIAFDNYRISEIEITIKNIDFSDINERQNVYKMIDYLNNYDTNLGSIIGNVSNWLEIFESYLQNTLNIEINQLSQSQFYLHLKNFTNITDISLNTYVTDFGIDIGNIDFQFGDIFYYIQSNQFTPIGYASWRDEIVYDNYQNPTKLTATKFYVCTCVFVRYATLYVILCFLFVCN